MQQVPDLANNESWLQSCVQDEKKVESRWDREDDDMGTDSDRDEEREQNRERVREQNREQNRERVRERIREETYQRKRKQNAIKRTNTAWANNRVFIHPKSSCRSG